MSLGRFAASLFEPFSAWGFWGVCRLSLFEPLFKGRRKQGCKKTMARPKGAQALRAIQEALDEGRSLPAVNYIPLPRIGEGLGEWFEAPSYEEGVGVDGKIRGPALGWGLGVSPTGQRPEKRGLGNSPARAKALYVEPSWYPPQGNALMKKKGLGGSPKKETLCTNECAESSEGMNPLMKFERLF